MRDGSGEVVKDYLVRGIAPAAGYASIWRDEDEETTFVGHGGSCPGYRTQLAMSNKDKIAIVFMTNGQGTDTAPW